MFTTFNLRVALWAALAVALLLNYVTWLRDYPPAAPPVAEQTTGSAGSGANAAPATTLGAAVPEAGPVPATPSAAASAATPITPAMPGTVPAITAPPANGASAAGAAAVPAAPMVHVVTDVLRHADFARGRRTDARRPARVSAGQGRDDAGSAVEPRQRREPVRVADRTRGRHRHGRADAPRALQRGFDRVAHAAGTRRAESAADVDRWQGRHGHEDIHVPPRQLPGRPRLQRRERILRELALRAIHATGAQQRAGAVLVLPSRELCVQRSGIRRRPQVPETDDGQEAAHARCADRRWLARSDAASLRRRGRAAAWRAVALPPADAGERVRTERDGPMAARLRPVRPRRRKRRFTSDPNCSINSSRRARGFTSSPTTES